MSKFMAFDILAKILRLPGRFKRYIEYGTFRQKYNIRESFSFGGKGIELYGSGIIEFGENSYCGNLCSFQSHEGCKIVIGNNCAISHNVRIYTRNRRSDCIITENGEIDYKSGDVIIGNNCWIGANVFVTEGVTIGDNVVIGANSVVTKDIPSNSVAVGCPAKVIRKE